MDTNTTNNKKHQDIISFQPTSSNRKLLDQALGVRRTKKGKIIGAWKPQRGAQTKLINRAMNQFLPAILAEQKAKAAQNQSSV